MRLTVLGASPSFPNPGGASSSYLVAQGATQLLIDCGHGSCSRLLTVVDPRSLDGIFVSHMHPDHFFDLVPLTYAFRFRYSDGTRVPLWLPPGGLPFLGRFLESLGLDDGFLAAPFDIGEYDPAMSLVVGRLDVRFAPAHHFVPAFAMRVAAAGADAPVLGYSTDTGPSDAVTRLLSGVDLALVEATLLGYPPDEQNHGHLTGTEAGRLARQAGVKRLLLTHYEESESADLLRLAAGEYEGSIELAREGQAYEL